MKWDIEGLVRKYELEPYPENTPEDDGYCVVINSDGYVSSAKWSVFKDGWVDNSLPSHNNEVLFFGTKTPHIPYEY